MLRRLATGHETVVRTARAVVKAAEAADFYPLRPDEFTATLHQRLNPDTASPPR